MAINRLSKGKPSKQAQVPFADPSLGVDRRASLAEIANVLQAELTAATGLVTQYAAPAATGFSVQVAPPTDGASVFLLLTPAAGYATGAIALPELSKCLNTQEVVVFSTQSVSTLTVTSSGATVYGAPTSLGAGTGFRLRFDLPTRSWYTVGGTAVGGGASSWAALSDKTTAPLPTDNTPLANALAAKANTSSLATVATSGAYADLIGRPTLATVATSGAYADLSGRPTLATVATSGAYADLSGRPTLATVATSGAYNDLTGRPTIPTSQGAANTLQMSDGAGAFLSATAAATTPGLSLAGAISSAAWTTAGVGLRETARTLTDTSSSGTVAAQYTHVLGGNTIAASAATTFTNYATAFLGTPTAGTNVTITNPWSLWAAGAIRATAAAFASNSGYTNYAIAFGATGGLRYNSAETFTASLHGGVTGTGLGASNSGASVGGSLGFGTSVWNNVDVFLTRDAANTLAQRNGTAAQESRVYGTFTDASNHRRIAVGMSTAGAGYIRPEGAGTGASGNTLQVSTGATTVASLPSASTAGAGARLFVTDANATTFASVVAGGGSNGVPVYSDGTNWRIG